MNLVGLVVDGLRQDHVGANHHRRAPFVHVPAAQIPHLDRFSQQGVVFKGAYPEAPPERPVGR
jgi:arylsulfatase A-like enzyme